MKSRLVFCYLLLGLFNKLRWKFHKYDYLQHELLVYFQKYEWCQCMVHYSHEKFITFCKLFSPFVMIFTKWIELDTKNDNIENNAMSKLCRESCHRWNNFGKILILDLVLSNLIVDDLIITPSTSKVKTSSSSKASHANTVPTPPLKVWVSCQQILWQYEHILHRVFF